jgi:alpha-L-fucosidase
MTDIRKTAGDSDWFTHDRFGLFIHWGLYSLAARHEWIKSREQIPDDVYDERYFKHFDPDLYDPQQWADAAAGAGMKYFVVTTKHHEGFCLWDSELTDYKATKTPAGRDLLKPMVDAFRSREMKVGFYHSIIDWHHPEYVIDTCNHPRRGELNIKGELDGMLDQAGGASTKHVDAGGDPNEGRDQSKYARYLREQVRELLDGRFGDVDLLWFDFSFPFEEDRTDFARGKGNEAWESAMLLDMIRKMRPDILMNDRLDLPDRDDAWDIKTPEQFQPRSWPTINGTPVVWEACQTFSGSWGYHRDEHSWRSVDNLILTLIDCVSKGGNLLLNVGPTGRGEFDERALSRLQGMGEWMRRHSRSIYGCTQAPAEFQTPRDCRLTYHPDKKRLYVHILAWPYKHLFLDGAFAERVEYAQLLNDASEVKMGLDNWHAKQAGADQSKTLVLNLPQTKPNVTVPVIELFLKD